MMRRRGKILEKLLGNYLVARALLGEQLDQLMLVHAEHLDRRGKRVRDRPRPANNALAAFSSGCAPNLRDGVEVHAAAGDDEGNDVRHFASPPCV